MRDMKKAQIIVTQNLIIWYMTLNVTSDKKKPLEKNNKVGGK